MKPSLWNVSCSTGTASRGVGMSLATAHRGGLDLRPGQPLPDAPVDAVAEGQMPPGAGPARLELVRPVEDTLVPVGGHDADEQSVPGPHLGAADDGILRGGAGQAVRHRGVAARQLLHGVGHALRPVPNRRAPLRSHQHVERAQRDGRRRRAVATGHQSHRGAVGLLRIQPAVARRARHAPADHVVARLRQLLFHQLPAAGVQLLVAGDVTDPAAVPRRHLLSRSCSRMSRSASGWSKGERRGATMRCTVMYVSLSGGPSSVDPRCPRLSARSTRGRSSRSARCRR